MKVAVVTFPGSNCDDDARHALALLGATPCRVWHKETELEPGVDAVVLPGGFAHGDYLRTGAIARFSPIMRAVERFAARGGPVLGICNGFQILLEAGLLPGAMLRNRQLRFVCDDVWVRVERTDTPWTRAVPPGRLLRLPVKHGEGNYVASPELLARLEGEGQVVFRYVDERGEPTPAANPNGSAANIAGVCNAARNVVGLMPHPENACEAILGSEDGRLVFESLLGEAARAGRG
ncbi:MAG TPA: phosphoribosylformylglycinamidine synthase subunit PurQ [Thermodesulfobacteriota bacterium]|nr:phosphoribosylformylglycinamidine synthase subunit PurQ [Thermodesulfobacteriota bacterium]